MVGTADQVKDRFVHQGRCHNKNHQHNHFSDLLCRAKTITIDAADQAIEPTAEADKLRPVLKAASGGQH